MVTWDIVRRLAGELPDVVEEPSFGTPAFKRRRKMFVRLRPEGDVLVLRIDEADKLHLIAQQPDVYFTTPHYDGYPAVLVRMAAISEDELRRMLEASWRYVAPEVRRRR